MTIGQNGDGRSVLRRHPTAASYGLEEVLVIALAAQRISRAISTDQIAAPLRERLDRWAADSEGRQQTVAIKVGELVRCPVCTGWWVSLAASALWPGRDRLRRGVSVAGMQVLLTLAERLVSEEGRAAVHEADITARRNVDATQPAPAAVA